MFLTRRNCRHPPEAGARLVVHEEISDSVGLNDQLLDAAVENTSGTTFKQDRSIVVCASAESAKMNDMTWGGKKLRTSMLSTVFDAKIQHCKQGQ